MERKRRLRFLTLATLALVLTLLTTACETTKVVVKAEVPELVFPEFPDPEPVTFDEGAGTVMMPLWYWQKIAEYRIDVDSIEEYMSRIRNEKTTTGEDE